MNNKLSIINIISGLSKTLNIANQMLPLYKQIKPYIIKTNNMLSNINKTNLSNKNEQPIKKVEVTNTGLTRAEDINICITCT